MAMINDVDEVTLKLWIADHPEESAALEKLLADTGTANIILRRTIEAL